MNKTLALFATIAFCMIATAMNAALEPAPTYDQQFRSDALEAYWLCVQKGLDAATAQLIQKYLLTQAVKIVNKGGDDLEITIRSAQTDAILDHAYVYSKDPYHLAQIGCRAIAENSDKAIVNIPFMPVKITAKIIKNPKVAPEVERCFHLKPGDLDKIHKVEFDERAVSWFDKNKFLYWIIPF